MTYQDTYEKLVTIGEFGIGDTASEIDRMYSKLVKRHVGLKAKSLAFGRNRHTIRLGLEGHTLFAYVPQSLVLYEGDFEEGMKPLKTFNEFEEVKEFLEGATI